MPLKIALCGLGSAAERAHLPALAKFVASGDVEIVGVSDLSTARLVRAAELLPGAQRFTTVSAMLARVDPHVLIVAAPPSAHLSAVRAGLESGVHVVCEKPLALGGHEVAETRSLLRGRSRLALVSVHQYEFAPAWKALSRVVAGALRCDEEWRLEVEVERPGTDPLSAEGWRSQPDREGGILGDHAVHYLAMVWKVAPQARVVNFERDGQGGRENARIELAAGRGEVDIRVSSDSGARHNRLRVIRPARGVTVAWEDDQLVVSHGGDRARRYPVASLADRDFVNSLYSPFYAGLITNLADPAWRLRRNQESIGVAGLLAAALDGVRSTEAAGVSFMDDLRAMARSVLLAFADLGVFLGSDRDRLMLKAHSLNPQDPEQLADFLDLAIAAELLTPSEAGRLRLAPEEALRLARSLEGHTPVPEDQATAWEAALRRS